MMDVELSRRMGQVTLSTTWRMLPIIRRVAIMEECKRAVNYDDLSPATRLVVEQAEAEQFGHKAAAYTLGDLINALERTGAALAENPDQPELMDALAQAAPYLGIDVSGQKNAPGKHDQAEHGSWAHGRAQEITSTLLKKAEELRQRAYSAEVRKIAGIKPDVLDLPVGKALAIGIVGIGALALTGGAMPGIPVLNQFTGDFGTHAALDVATRIIGRFIMTAEGIKLITDAMNNRQEYNP